MPGECYQTPLSGKEAEASLFKVFNMQPRLRNPEVAVGQKLEYIPGSPRAFVKIIPGLHPQGFKFSRYRPAPSLSTMICLLALYFCLQPVSSTHYPTSSRSITLLTFFLKTLANNLSHASGLDIHQPILALDTIHHVSKFSFEFRAILFVFSSFCLLPQLRSRDSCVRLPSP